MFPLSKSAFLMRLGLHNYEKRNVSSFQHFASDERKIRAAAVVIALEYHFSQKIDGSRCGCESYARIEIYYRIYSFHESEAQFVL
jgi:hypothetical protein